MIIENLLEDEGGTSGKKGGAPSILSTPRLRNAALETAYV
jgi:hypothetical protein